jgi:Domain of unknown function (DUF1905)/Bacteriocin-protection, YdeI or OmpD-Associated
MKKFRFNATIEEGRGGGAFVAMPLDVEKEFGTRGRVPVKVTFDSEPYRGSIVPMGGRHLLGVRKDIREAIGKSVGDRVAVSLERDTAERVVEIPPELAAALRRNAAARKRFDALSYTHRREYVEWIAGAKKEETRTRRVERTIQRLTE